ncbi:MAG: hypothetical protein AAGC66_01235 [Leifsonia sp.]
MNNNVSRYAARHLWFFIVIGIIGVVAVLVTAAVPASFVALPIVAASFSVWGVDLVVTRRSSAPLKPPLWGVALAYVVVLGLMVFGALILACFVARGETYWLACVLAALLFIVSLVGAWVPERRSSQSGKSAADTNARLEQGREQS